MTTAVITAQSFPTPALTLRSADPAELDRARAFAHHQADAAETLRLRLAAEWPTFSTRQERVSALRAAHAELVAWRHQLALRAPGRLGQGIPLDASRFVTTLREGGANYDRLGYLGRLRVGSTWEPESRLYVGGESTPAHEVMLTYGQAALDRFAAENPDGDELVNVVRLDEYRIVAGNRLVRGAAADRIAAELVERIAARGADASRVETGGEVVYAVTASPGDADVMFDAALTRLADAVALDPTGGLRAWQEARYLLYQAPRHKKGSDAVARVFLTAVGSLLLGRAPVMQSDVDLRCMVLGQNRATVMPADASLLD